MFDHYVARLAAAHGNYRTALPAELFAADTNRVSLNAPPHGRSTARHGGTIQLVRQRAEDVIPPRRSSRTHRHGRPASCEISAPARVLRMKEAGAVPLGRPECEMKSGCYAGGAWWFTAVSVQWDEGDETQEALGTVGFRQLARLRHRACAGLPLHPPATSPADTSPPVAPSHRPFPPPPIDREDRGPTETGHGRPDATMPCTTCGALHLVRRRFRENIAGIRISPAEDQSDRSGTTA
jgi:hypothetical protein